MQKMYVQGRPGDYSNLNDKTLYSVSPNYRVSKTGKRPVDLPSSFMPGMFFRRLGWIDLSNVVGVTYRASPFTNHFFKDDSLLISYSHELPLGRYKVVDGWWTKDLISDCGVDYRIFGNQIITALAYLYVYSPLPVLDEIVEQVEAKRQYVIASDDPVLREIIKQERTLPSIADRVRKIRESLDDSTA